jgi:uncharacterized delta-60 repeat protein
MKDIIIFLRSKLPLLLFLIPTITFSQDGIFDASFNDDGKQFLSLPNKNIYGWQVLVLDDDRILLGGNAMQNNIYDFFLAAYLPDGTLDNLFADNGMLNISAGTNGSSVLIDMLQLDDGKILISAKIDNVEKLIRLNTDGSFDSAFGVNGMVNANPGSGYMTLQNNQTLLSGYYFDGNERLYNFSRYNSDGTYDTNFGNNGIALLNPTGYSFNLISAVKIQSDGKILVAGTSYNSAVDKKPALVRLNVDGSLDFSFGNNGVIIETLGAEEMGIFNSLDILPDGKIVAAGNMEYTNGTGGFGGTNPAVVKYLQNGTLDSTFATNGKLILNTFNGANDGLRAMLIQPDYKIVIGGSSGSAFPDIQSYYYLSRLNADGTYDNTFGNGGSVFTKFNDSETNANVKIVLQNDYKIITSALSRDTADNLFNTVICRFTNDNSLSVSSAPAVNDDILIYPNPFSFQTTLRFSKEQKNTTINIIDALGRQIKTINFTGKELIIEKGMMKKGIYFVQTVDQKRNIVNLKIIIQ